MVTSCEIRFDNNPKATFQSGQTITGTVILTLTEKKKFRALYLKIEGSAKCMWTVTKGTGNKRRSVTYSGKEDYLNQVTYLFGSQSGTTPVQIPAGTTTYSFACILPQQIPSSVEGKYGNIRYSCKAVLDRPWKSDKEFRLSFTVIKAEDLNLVTPSLFLPAKSEIIRRFYCCCFKSKPFQMCVSIPFTGYVPGQKIEVTIHMNNQSNIDIEGTKVSLERGIQYISQAPRKKIRFESLTVCEIFGTGMRACGLGEFKILLPLPPLAPTNMDYCSVLTTSYQLKVLAKASGAHKNPHLNIPITIGTIPLRSSVQAPHYDAVMNNSIASSSSHPSAPRNFNLPPPSYEEAMRIVPEMTENNHDVSVFNPLYPVWNFGSSQPPSATTSPSKVP
ncbi:CLUMA_CG012196, isoform A [Clunio marinus]|uniref:CLUMA_CG012196, isoform A n=1 Tax=Clunio marinus TaxID=568069 RepID=A0A1J1IJI7_9DIPT|nr:CLUMA_CG012196, isoform A [Clunio marinus]